MITVIIGPPGSGKSTLARQLAPMFDTFVEADKLVAELYKGSDLLDFFNSDVELSKCIVEGSVDKSVLIKILTDNETLKTKLEDFVFKTVFAPLINDAVQTSKSLLVDGIMPRFIAYFDQVIKVDASPEIRFANLMKRGVNEKRARELIALYNKTVG